MSDYDISIKPLFWIFYSIQSRKRKMVGVDPPPLYPDPRVRIFVSRIWCDSLDIGMSRKVPRNKICASPPILFVDCSWITVAALVRMIFEPTVPSPSATGHFGIYITTKQRYMRTEPWSVPIMVTTWPFTNVHVILSDVWPRPTRLD